MKRGDIVLAAAAGDYGKPRPYVVIQADLPNEQLESVALCPLTTQLRTASLVRIAIEPNAENNLRSSSQAMIDKLLTIRRDRVRERIGRIDETTVSEINRALMLFLGLD